ncbi:phosphatase PAP2 family protein [Mesobacillus foraminis]|uniref:phosphatase PAP2 family protein n=1 Tax=Mesobacillus foraminis TaxID=279826 RepID=UPI001BE81C0C|nr:phosphatase PAP2 family protein [Mesobacillus foraminis]MBT2757980.1 phosphatase PAP2 family protein [Mesobacillus foraminis]
MKQRLKDIPRFMKLRIITILLLTGFSTLIFVELSGSLTAGRLHPIDPKVMGFVQTYSSPFLDSIMIFITTLGSKGVIGLLLVACISLILLKQRNYWGTLISFLTVAGGGILNLLLKGLFERERPEINRIIDADGFSFPSGHSMGSIIFYGFLGYLVFRSEWKIHSKFGWITLLSMVIFLVGISRVYLGVHYPSDVLAGFSAGFIWLILCISILELIYWAKRARKFERRLEDENKGYGQETLK